jgi:hypothetical protein
MKSEPFELNARFDAETAFPLAVNRQAAQRGLESRRFEALKRVLVEAQLQGEGAGRFDRWVRLAADEAAALAWASPYPFLVLPALLEERVAHARARAQRQWEIQERSRPLIALAA